MLSVDRDVEVLVRMVKAGAFVGGGVIGRRHCVKGL